MIQAKVLTDSASPYGRGDRLTTLEVTFPRFILAEFNTHRAFSRNSASSRAIPVQKQIESVMNDPFIPERWPINQAGMSADAFIADSSRLALNCEARWLQARDAAVSVVTTLLDNGVHKQIANRLLEPFMWHTVIVSATEWQNFFVLRISEFAQPEMRQTAEAIHDAMEKSLPTVLDFDEWHLPLLEDDELELDVDQRIMISVARCAAVTYGRQRSRDHDKEYTRYESLATQRHLSPFEHAATPSSDSYEWANFYGWRQARYDVERGQRVRT